jgi:hypothetical protein
MATFLRKPIWLLGFSLFLSGISHADLGSDIAGACLTGLLNALCRSACASFQRSIGVGMNYTETERYYFRAQPLEDSLAGVRFLENVGLLQEPAPRINLTKEQWYDIFFSGGTTATKFDELLTKADLKTLPILTPEQMELRAAKDPLVLQASRLPYFGKKDFLAFNESRKHEQTRITVFNFVLSYYSPEDNRVFLVQIPDFTVKSIGDLLNRYYSNKGALTRRMFFAGEYQRVNARIHESA